MGYRMGDPIHTPTIRCPKPDCDRLLINGEACGCTWLAEPEPDPLVGTLIACTDPRTGKVIAAGRVTDVARDQDGLSLTLAQHETPEGS
ncbi:hypothetical protein OG244_28625 [Streptomyces brevispora]|uniref:hypothetical protein n=1 Tax=Streptomyces brevispora TaxID=887462 RepID=UPI002E3639BA|nr:hypothetical protein [Streptomyces brevispora]